MSDVENPPVTIEDVTEPDLLPVRVGAAQLDRWIEAGPEQAIARVEAMVKVLEVLTVASIRRTYPSDWLIHVSVDHDGTIIREVGYLQDCGAQRAGKVWSIEVSEAIVTRENHPDGTYSYHLLADAWSRKTGERIENAEGSRWSGSKFFERQVAADGQVDPTVVRKSAYANLRGRCVRSLAGLSAVPLEVLRAAGLDVTKVLRIGYEKGGKGGESTGAGVGTAEVLVGFGNAKGKPAAQLSDKDLVWYLKAYAENLADPSKDRFAKANQRALDALRAEQERRTHDAAHEAETGTKPEPKPTAAPPELPPSSPRGRKIGDAYVKLHDVAKGDGKLISAILRLVTKDLGQETGILSEVSDVALDKLLAAPDTILAALVEQAKKTSK